MCAGSSVVECLIQARGLFLGTGRLKSPQRATMRGCECINKIGFKQCIDATWKRPSSPHHSTYQDCGDNRMISYYNHFNRLEKDQSIYFICRAIIGGSLLMSVGIVVFLIAQCYLCVVCQVLGGKREQQNNKNNEIVILWHTLDF